MAQQGTSTDRLATQDPWVIDLGANDHMTGTSGLLSNLDQSSSLPNVTLANDSVTTVSSLGTANLNPNLSLSSVLYIPSFTFNLLSISKLTKLLNCAAIFLSTHCIFQDLKTRKIIGGHETGGLYYLDWRSSSTLVASHLSISPLQHHCRLGHPSLQNLKSLVSLYRQIKSLQCEAYQLGKHHRVPFASRNESCVSSPFHLVHSDIWGPINTPSLLGFRYFVIFVDDYSKVTYLYLMKQRSELYSIFKSFYMEIKTQFNASLHIFRSDNVHEYFHTSLSQFFYDHGIIHQSSCPHTPQQNGVAERKMHHLLEVTRALKLHMRIPKSYWSDVVLTICLLINRIPSTVLGGQIPYIVLSPNAPLLHLSPNISGCVLCSYLRSKK